MTTLERPFFPESSHRIGIPATDNAAFESVRIGSPFTSWMRPFICLFAFVITSASLASLCLAQGATQLTVKDYARAEQFLGWNLEKLVLNLNITPAWIGGGKQFWFLHQSHDGHDFVIVDTKTGAQTPAFDHVRLAESLSAANQSSYTANTLPFEKFSFKDEQRSIEFSVGKREWECDLRTYACHAVGYAYSQDLSYSVSPDGKWGVFVRNNNLWADSLSKHSEAQLTYDGRNHNAYGVQPESDCVAVTEKIRYPLRPPVTAVWAPDSRRFISYQLDESRMQVSYLVQSVPPGAIGSRRPLLHEYRYPYPGDKEVAKATYVIIDVQTKQVIKTDLPVEEVTYLPAPAYGAMWWSEDGKSIYAILTSRGALKMQMFAIDAATGKSKMLIEERGTTELQNVPGGFGVPVVKVMDSGRKVIWFSERDGWGHLYLYDVGTGKPARQLTEGPWTVGGIVYVDNANDYVYFYASGREHGEDPYLKHLYRIRTDGQELQLLTPENADHTVWFSPSGAGFVDSFSRADTTPVAVLRDIDGTVIRQVAEADTSALLAKGWKYPEPFHAKAADGTTDIYGVMFKPSNFDANAKYPIIDSIYPGPQTIRTPKTLLAALDDGDQTFAIAELGFIVIAIDGRGTPNRSRSFHDFSYQHLGSGGGLEDHIAAFEQLGKQYPYLDLTRVGIYGHSGGGFASVRALLAYPNFYKVAVASAGNHDMRGNSAWWGERWIGSLSNEESYVEASNPALALKSPLKGKLLLAWGDMDDNVSPALSIQLVDSLIKTNSNFDMLVIPNTNHFLSSVNPYFIRRRWDYFVQNLLGKMPPPEYKITTIPDGFYQLKSEQQVGDVP